MEKMRGEQIIDAILRNMEESKEPLRYSVLVPVVYRVYLHPDDYERLSAILGRISDEIRRALDERLKDMNQPGFAEKVAAIGLRRSSRPSYEMAGAGWEIEFLVDINGEIRQGEALVRSSLARASPPELGGTPTFKVTTTSSVAGFKPRREYPASSISERREVLARITFPAACGMQVYEVMKPVVWIGRAGGTTKVDIVLDNPAVSRPHLRIRYDAPAGRFMIANFGSYGASVNGRLIPQQQYGRGDDVPSQEEVLPSKARIGLAEDTVMLDFEAVVVP